MFYNEIFVTYCKENLAVFFALITQVRVLTMSRIIKSITAILFCSFPLLGFAQSSTPLADSTKPMAATAKVKKPIIKKPKLVDRELSFGFRLNTDGWGVYAQKGKSKSDMKESELFYNVRYWELELDEKKHPKEIKRTSDLSTFNDTKPRSFAYGKVNNFYSIKLGYGNRKMIAGKPDPGTVSIHWFYSGGLALGLLKPYYIELYDGTSIKYTDSTKEEFLNKNDIIGSSGFSKGIGEMKFAAGIHAKTGLHFDFAASKKTIIAIEFGGNVEVYSRTIQLMANQKDVPYFVNIFGAIQFGKRW